VEGGVLDGGAAKGVDHGHVASPACFGQAGHTELGIGSQFERVAV